MSEMLLSRTLNIIQAISYIATMVPDRSDDTISRALASGESQLILTVQDLAKSIDLGEQTDLILLTFSKELDKVPHQRLLYKAYYYGVRG
jgi:hypothetical protein